MTAEPIKPKEGPRCLRCDYWMKDKEFCCCPARGTVIGHRIYAINPKPLAPDTCKLFVEHGLGSPVILTQEDFLEENKA